MSVKRVEQCWFCGGFGAVVWCACLHSEGANLEVVMYEKYMLLEVYPWNCL